MVWVLAHDPSDGQLHVEQLVTELCHPCAQHHEKSLVVGSWSPEPRTPNALSILPAEGGGCARICEEARGCTGMLGEARGCTGDAWVVGTEPGLDPASVPAPAPTIPSTAASPPYGFNFDETGFY